MLLILLSVLSAFLAQEVCLPQNIYSQNFEYCLEDRRLDTHRFQLKGCKYG